MTVTNPPDASRKKSTPRAKFHVPGSVREKIMRKVRNHVAQHEVLVDHRFLASDTWFHLILDPRSQMPHARNQTVIIRTERKTRHGLTSALMYELLVYSTQPNLDQTVSTCSTTSSKSHTDRFQKNSIGAKDSGYWDRQKENELWRQTIRGLARRNGKEKR